VALSNEQVDELMQREKRITQPVLWRGREDPTGLELDVAVGFLNPESSLWELGRLKAIAVPGKRVRCALLYGTIPLMRLCDAHAHFHKHRWSDGNERDQFVPSDLRAEVYRDSPDEAIIDFLVECKIELKALHQRMLL